jgi:SAM-dependent methyltransferase
MNTDYAIRFKDEKLGLHWQVDETRESFDRLLNHLENKTNVKPFFEEALRRLDLDGSNFPEGMIVADIGSGVSWTSAILARHKNVRYVYAVDPSENRLYHARYVARHLGVENKVKIIPGTFLVPNIHEQVDLVVLSASLHHCYGGQLKGLFDNIKDILKPSGVVLITNEHFVTWAWVFKRMLSYAKHFKERKKLFYYPLSNLRSPDPFGGEHWRMRGELEEIFANNGFRAKFFIHDGDMCKDKPNLYQRVGWRYYHAILTRKD